MRILLVLGIPVLAILAVIAMVSSRSEPPKKEQPELDPIVDVLELEMMTANFTVRSQGTVRPRTETVLSAEISGTITKLSPNFVAGGVFKAQEVLMRIDPSNYDVAVDRAEALLNQRQIEFDGASKLRVQGYRAESEYASAAAALAGATADLVTSKRNLERTFIRLPYAGIVRGKESDLGQFVGAGTRLGVVFATDIAEIRLPLTDQDLAFVDLPVATQSRPSGDAVGPSVTLSAIRKGSYTEWQATIVRTEGVVDENSRVTYAVAQVSDPYGLHSKNTALPMGTFVAATISGTVAEDVIRVPRGLVRGTDELVFLDEDLKISIRKVDIIRADADFVYIVGGAISGERVVATALATPVNGMVVRVAGEADASSEIIVSQGSDQ